MRQLYIFIFAFLIISCSKEDEIEETNEPRLVSIEYVDEALTWIENYSYSSDNKLSIIEQFHPEGNRIEISYQNDQMKEYTGYKMKDNQAIFRDSFGYNSNGLLHTIHRFSSALRDTIELTWIYTYEYDNEDKVSKRRVIHLPTQLTNTKKVYWNGKNIEKFENYNSDDELVYESISTYDNKVNYNKGFPLRILGPTNWGENNEIETNDRYFNGNDPTCEPCITEYEYNADDYPVSITTFWGRKMFLTYE